MYYLLTYQRNTYCLFLYGISCWKNSLVFFSFASVFFLFFHPTMSDHSYDTESQHSPKHSSPKTEIPQSVKTYHENHPVQITTIRLNGPNYFRWSQSVRLYLRGRGKIGYITGDKKQPDKEGADYDSWDAENSMVMTWLVNSMTEEIGANYLCYATAKDLWESVARMYSDLDNQS